MCGKIRVTKQYTIWTWWGVGSENFETRRECKVGSFDSSNRGAGTVKPEGRRRVNRPIVSLEIRSVYCAWNWCGADGDSRKVTKGNWTRTVVFWNVRLSVWASSFWTFQWRTNAIKLFKFWTVWLVTVGITLYRNVETRSSKDAVSHSMWLESSSTSLSGFTIGIIWISLKFIPAHVKFPLVYVIQLTCLSFTY